jgi:hypothetical protein
MDYFAGLDIPMDETHVAFSSGKARVPNLWPQRCQSN